MFDKNAKVEFTCPNCKSKFSISVGQLQSGETIACPDCQLKMGTKEVQKGLQDCENQLANLRKRLSKTINIKFKL